MEKQQPASIDTSKNQGPSSSVTPLKQLRVAALILFIAVAAAMAFVYHPSTGWNVNTRLDLVFAVADRGELAIDAYHATPPYDTGDKTFANGHHYSDKPIGTGMLALPFYWAAQLASGGRLDFVSGHYLMKSVAVALPGGLAAALFFMLMARLGAPPRRAIILTALSVFGTMWFGYGTVFQPYMPAMAASLGALWLVFFPPAGRLAKWNSFAVGALLGYVLLVELLFGIVVLGIGTVYLLRLLDQVGIFGVRAFAEMTGHRTTVRKAAPMAALFWAGVILLLAPYFILNYHLYGELTLPYRYEVSERFREGMARGLMGATVPRASWAYFLTLHPYRGLFYWSPLFLAALAGCVVATRQYGKRRIAGWLGLGLFLAYLLYNSAYYMWWGGWTMGPRHLIPSFPFLLLGLGELARIDKLSAFAKRPALARPAWVVVLMLGIASVALTLPLSLYDPQLPQSNQDEALAQADFSTPLYVPQLPILKLVYTGYLDIRPWKRIERWKPAYDAPMQISGLEKTTLWNTSGDRFANVSYLVLFLAAIGGLVFWGWRKCPEKLPAADRADFPFKTIDGSAAPL